MKTMTWTELCAVWREHHGVLDFQLIQTKTINLGGICCCNNLSCAVGTWTPKRRQNGNNILTFFEMLMLKRRPKQCLQFFNSILHSMCFIRDGDLEVLQGCRHLLLTLGQSECGSWCTCLRHTSNISQSSQPVLWSSWTAPEGPGCHILNCRSVLRSSCPFPLLGALDLHCCQCASLDCEWNLPEALHPGDEFPAKYGAHQRSLPR